MADASAVASAVTGIIDTGAVAGIVHAGAVAGAVTGAVAGIIARQFRWFLTGEACHASFQPCGYL